MESRQNLIRMFNFFKDEINKYQSKLDDLQSNYEQICTRINQKNYSQITRLIGEFVQKIKREDFLYQDKKRLQQFRFMNNMLHIHTLKIYLKHFISIYENKIKELEFCINEIKQKLKSPTDALSRLSLYDPPPQFKNPSVQDLD